MTGVGDAEVTVETARTDKYGRIPSGFSPSPKAAQGSAGSEIERLGLEGGAWLGPNDFGHAHLAETLLKTEHRQL